MFTLTPYIARPHALFAIMKSVLTLLTLLALVYSAVVMLVWIRQDSLLYVPGIPSRQLSATPASIGLGYEDVYITTADGETLHAWYVPARAERATVLFLHGNAGNISHRLDSLRIFNALGLSVLMPDYRGYGQSTGKPSEQGTYADALAAWQYLKEVRGIDPGSIVVFGRSLGGAVATWLAAQHPPGALIVESTFRSVPDLAAEIYWFLPVRLLARIDYPVEQLIGSVRAPLLVVHSRGDDIIPFSHGLALYDAAHEPKWLLELRGDHNSAHLLSGQDYVAGLESFLDAAGFKGSE